MTPLRKVKTVRFGPFAAELAAGELRKDGTRIKIQEQPFRILEILLERPGEVVSREEIRAKLWPADTFVEFEHSLNTAVNRLRAALGDSAGSAQYIETIPRRGYRFVGAVEAPHQASQRPAPSIMRWRAKIFVAALAAAALLTAWWFARSGAPSFDSEAYQIRRLTYDGGLAYHPAISADGKLVAFASDRAGNGNLDIWLLQTAGGEPIQLTFDGADEFEPCFSPDGSQVAFRSGRDAGGIYVVPTLGGQRRQVAPRGYRPRFSPDGKRVAYWYGKEQLSGGPRSRVLVVPIDGGQPTEVGFGRSPVWSPDGEHLLYLRSRTAARYVEEWAVAPLNGEEPFPTGAVQLLRQSELEGDPRILGRAFVPQSWLSDGQVLFAAGMGQAINVWSIYISPRSGQASGSPQRITTASGEHRSVSAANNHRIVFADVSENRDIWILPTNTSQGTATGEVFRATHNVAIDELPSLSADGTLLAFHSTRSGTTDVWMKNLLTNEIKRLTATEKALGPVTASADGDFVAFVTGIRNATGWHFDTFAIGTADDGHLEKLCEDCGIVSDWSSSGNLLVGYYRSATTQAHGLETGVTLTNLTTGQSRILFENQPDWRFSPDEKWLAFHKSSRQGVGIQQVFIAPLPEEGEIQESDLIPVTDGTDNSFRPAWSPNGNLLYYASERDGHTCIYAQPLNPATKQPAGNTCEVFHVHSARLSPAAIRNSGLIGLSVAKDKIAFTMVETTSDIWIMEPRAAH